MCSRVFSIFPDNCHPLAVGRMTTDIACDNARTLRNIAVYNRTILAARFFFLYLLCKRAVRRIILGRRHNA